MIAIIGAITFGIAAILYILIALGLPLGEFAMGGKYKIVPPKLRIMIAVSVLIQLFAIMIILQTGGIIPNLFSIKVNRIICYFFAVYLSLNSFLNAFSKSKKERYTATPLSVITAICFWITAMNA